MGCLFSTCDFSIEMAYRGLGGVVWVDGSGFWMEGLRGCGGGVFLEKFVQKNKGGSVNEGGEGSAWMLSEGLEAE